MHQLRLDLGSLVRKAEFGATGQTSDAPDYASLGQQGRRRCLRALVSAVMTMINLPRAHYAGELVCRHGGQGAPMLSGAQAEQLQKGAERTLGLLGAPQQLGSNANL